MPVYSDRCLPRLFCVISTDGDDDDDDDDKRRMKVDNRVCTCWDILSVSKRFGLYINHVLNPGAAATLALALGKHFDKKQITNGMQTRGGRVPLDTNSWWQQSTYTHISGGLFFPDMVKHTGSVTDDDDSFTVATQDPYTCIGVLYI